MLTASDLSFSRRRRFLRRSSSPAPHQAKAGNTSPGIRTPGSVMYSHLNPAEAQAISDEKKVHAVMGEASISPPRRSPTPRRWSRPLRKSIRTTWSPCTAAARDSPELCRKRCPTSSSCPTPGPASSSEGESERIVEVRRQGDRRERPALDGPGEVATPRLLMPNHILDG